MVNLLTIKSNYCIMGYFHEVQIFTNFINGLTICYAGLFLFLKFNCGFSVARWHMECKHGQFLGYFPKKRAKENFPNLMGP